MEDEVEDAAEVVAEASESESDFSETDSGLVPDKGQLISKCLFGVFNSSKNQTKAIRLEVP